MVKISETIESYLENFMSNKPRINTMHISKLNLLKAPNNRIDEESLDAAFNNGFGTLIPIKLDIEIDGKKLKENFLWDKNEPYLTLEAFAKIFRGSGECAEVGWKLLGLSVAEWSLVWFILLGAWAVYIAGAARRQ